MSIALITGSCGLIGSESVDFFAKKGFDIVGIDNNLRELFFGKEGSTIWQKNKLKKSNKKYIHFNTDIRSYKKLEKVFKKYKKNIKIIIHCAAQPSHDYGKNYPVLDFNVNATGTLNILELTKTVLETPNNNLLSDELLKRTENLTESLTAEVKYIRYVIYSKLGEIEKANFNLKEAYSINPAIYDYFRDIFPTIPQLHVFKNMNAS